VLVFPSGGRCGTTGDFVKLLPSGVWGAGALASPGCTSSTSVLGDPIRSWRVTGGSHKISESDGGLSKRDGARCFPLVLTRVGERKQFCAAGRPSSSLPLYVTLSWTRNTSVGLCKPIDLLESFSRERARNGVPSGRISRSRIEGGCSWE
jgi:hypothetical protein